MEFDPESILPPGARIKVVGVGGGGGNATNTMIRSNLEGVDFVACNTDIQSLRFSLAPTKIQIGKDLTRGLGAGADPDVGREAALEDRHELQEHLEGADMVFITAGMGGGTGTGGAAVVAQIARELGALTVGVVTKPFSFEGKRRKKHADAGIARLRECVDTLITIPNQRLLELATPDLSMIDAFKLADEVLVNAVKGISDIINIPGTVNVDFADVKTVMSCMGQALMGIGAGEGEKRAMEAAQRAIRSPLLEDIDIEGATGVLVNITAGSNLTLMEVNEACSVVQEAAHEDANFIFGAVIDESLGDSIRVTVIATGFPVDGEDKDAIDAIKHQQRAQLAQGPSLNPFNTRLTEPPLTKRHHMAEPLSRSQARPTSPEPSRVLSEPRNEPLITPRRESRPPAPPVPEPRMAEPVTPEPVVEARPAPAPEAVHVAPAHEPDPWAMEAPRHEEPVVESAAQPLATTVEPTPTMNLSGGGDESEELARWTMGFTPPLEGEDDDMGMMTGEEPAQTEIGERKHELDDFLPLVDATEKVQEEAPFVEDSYSAEADDELPRYDFHRERIAGATAYEETYPAVQPAARDQPKALADSLFEDDVAAGGAQNEEGLASESKVRSEEPAPLDALFGDEQKFVGSEIDRKIDEALEMAERMKSDNRANPSGAVDDDDLDVPAFLRNGMKDLPLS